MAQLTPAEQYKSLRCRLAANVGGSDQARGKALLAGSRGGQEIEGHPAALMPFDPARPV